MSFHFTTTSRIRVARTKIANDKNLPVSIKDFLRAGIEGLLASSAELNEETIVRIVASGHLCIGEGSYNASNAQIELTPIILDL